MSVHRVRCWANVVPIGCCKLFSPRALVWVGFFFLLFIYSRESSSTASSSTLLTRREREKGKILRPWSERGHASAHTYNIGGGGREGDESFRNEWSKGEASDEKGSEEELEGENLVCVGGERERKGGRGGKRGVGRRSALVSRASLGGSPV